jgi:hypothetical protein
MSNFTYLLEAMNRGDRKAAEGLLPPRFDDG